MHLQLPSILARYQVCHVTNKLRISSTNLWLATIQVRGNLLFGWALIIALLVIFVILCLTKTISLTKFVNQWGRFFGLIEEIMHRSNLK